MTRLDAVTRFVDGGLVWPGAEISALIEQLRRTEAGMGGAGVLSACTIPTGLGDLR